jgi:arabinogalactan endo-1,4-beta-galactosidase
MVLMRGLRVSSLLFSSPLFSCLLSSCLLFASPWAPALGQTAAPEAAQAPANPTQPPRQPYFIYGADVSFLRDLEARGIQFKDDGQVHPGLDILRHHGYNWVRLRIMNEPTPLPNTLAYTLAEAKAARAAGFHLLLDFHYSDDWADPAHETTPKAWVKLPHDELVKAVFNFTRDTVAAFREQGTMPEMVQIGNEITSGMLWPDGKLPDRWPQFAELLTAGVRGAEAGKGDQPRPLIMIHIDQGGNSETTKWFFDNLIVNRVPFDVIGQSYYPWWQGSLDDLRRNLVFEATRYKKPIIVVETAYDWRDGEEFKGKKPPFPQTPEGQAEFLAALVKVVKETPNGLGKGVFWWEPMAEGAIAKRAMFNDQHEALPAVKVFDPPAP